MNLNFSLSHLKAHSHTTNSSKYSSTKTEDNLKICLDFKKLAMKSGINYDIETFQKAFGFSSETKSESTNTAIPTKKEFNESCPVSEEFKEVTKQAGINYNIEAFHKAFGFAIRDIGDGQDTLNDTSDDECSLKNAKTFHDKKKVKQVKDDSFKQFHCEKCDKYFKSIEFMKVHFASDHDKIKKALKCPDCHKILADKANLRGHLAIHSGKI